MNSGSPTPAFCKTARCPSSESLLRYRAHSLAIVQRLTVERHLRVCDFCNAEIELLKRHRVEAEPVEKVEMPWQLQKLAASLFSSSSGLSLSMIRSPLSH